MSRHPTRKRKAPTRVPFDWYVEPRWAAEALFNMVPLSGSVGDPACGLGTIPEVARDRGHDIVASDLVDRGYERLSAVADFLDDVRHIAGIDNIVCNPPFGYRRGIAEAFVRQAFKLCPATVSMLLPLRWLSTIERYRLFTHHRPSRILYFSERPSMPPGHLIAELGAKAFQRGKIDYCWIVWQRGPNGYHGDAIGDWIPPRGFAAGLPEQAVHHIRQIVLGGAA